MTTDDYVGCQVIDYFKLIKELEQRVKELEQQVETLNDTSELVDRLYIELRSRGFRL